MSKKILKNAKSAGEQYAREQIESDHFRAWVHDQVYEASRMAPSQVLPLETAADAKVIAENMLQQLGWDVKRDLGPLEILKMSGAGSFESGAEDMEIVGAFYEGFDKALDDSKVVAWLADEILFIHEQVTGATEGGGRRLGASASEVREQQPQRPRRRLPPSKDIPIHAIPKYKLGRPKANYAIETLVTQGGRRAKWRFDSGYYATLEDAIAMSENLIGFGEVGWYKGVRVVDVRDRYKPVWEWPEKWGRSGRGVGEAQAARGRPAPLIEDKLYTVTWVGGRKGPMTARATVAFVQGLRQSWRESGRSDPLKIQVWYRDGSAVPYADLERQVERR